MTDDALIDLSNYNLLENIGKGASAEVFTIEDKRTKTIYAAKILRKAIKENDESEKLYLNRELNIMLKIHHPNIVNLVGFSPYNFNNEDRPVFITELVSNGSLQDVINLQRQGKAPEIWNSTKKLINTRNLNGHC